MHTRPHKQPHGKKTLSMEKWSRLCLVLFASVGFSSCNTFEKGPVGNTQVPQPAQSVDLNRYLGRWYEIARYEAGFQKDCEYVTADYHLDNSGRIQVTNACRRGSADAPIDIAKGQAYVVEGSHNAKLRVSFFWPFYGNYWVLDRGASYEWAIIGEPSGHYLWLLFREPLPPDHAVQTVKQRAHQMGYDLGLLRMTRQQTSSDTQ